MSTTDLSSLTPRQLAALGTDEALALLATFGQVGELALLERQRQMAEPDLLTNAPSGDSGQKGIAVRVVSMPSWGGSGSSGGGTVNVSFPASMAVNGTVAVANTSSTVTVSNWPAVQAASGTVAISSVPSHPVTGTVAVSNFPASSSTVSVSNLPATQPVNGTVFVAFPAVQTVNGTVFVSPPAVQPVNGTVAVNFPAVQSVKGPAQQQVMLSWDEVPGTAATEGTALATFRTENAVALGSAGTYTVPSGKTLKILNVGCYVKATSTVNNLARFRIRQAAPTVGTSAPAIFNRVFSHELSATAAGAAEANNYPVNIDVAAGQAICFTYLTAANTCTVGMSVDGYLY